MKSVFKHLAIGSLLLLPMLLPQLLFAYSGIIIGPIGGGGGGFNVATANAMRLVVAGVQIVTALAMVYFLWGLMQYLIGDVDKKTDAKAAMIYSLLLMFVMFSVWGLVALLQGFFGATSNVTPTLGIPRIQS